MISEMIHYVKKIKVDQPSQLPTTGSWTRSITITVDANGQDFDKRIDLFADDPEVLRFRL